MPLIARQKPLRKRDLAHQVASLGHLSCPRFRSQSASQFGAHYHTVDRDKRWHSYRLRRTPTLPGRPLRGNSSRFSIHVFAVPLAKYEGFVLGYVTFVGQWHRPSTTAQRVQRGQRIEGSAPRSSTREHQTACGCFRLTGTPPEQRKPLPHSLLHTASTLVSRLECPIRGQRVQRNAIFFTAGSARFWDDVVRAVSSDSAHGVIGSE